VPRRGFVQLALAEVKRSLERVNPDKRLQRRKPKLWHTIWDDVNSPRRSVEAGSLKRRRAYLTSTIDPKEKSALLVFILDLRKKKIIRYTKFKLFK